MAGHEWFTLHFKGDSPMNENPFRDQPFMQTRCPNVFFLLQTNPVTNPFDKAALSEERTLYLTPTRSVPQVFPDGIPISIARSQIFPSMKNEGMHDYHLD